MSNINQSVIGVIAAISLVLGADIPEAKCQVSYAKGYRDGYHHGYHNGFVNGYSNGYRGSYCGCGFTPSCWYGPVYYGPYFYHFYPPISPVNEVNEKEEQSTHPDVTPSTLRRPTSQPSRREAYVRVSVPQNSQVYINGHLTTMSGRIRTFSTPSLQLNKTYTLVIKAQKRQGSTTIEQAKRVVLTAGETKHLSFDFDQADSNSVASKSQ